jgi:hypothetical protein
MRLPFGPPERAGPACQRPHPRPRASSRSRQAAHSAWRPCASELAARHRRPAFTPPGPRHVSLSIHSVSRSPPRSRAIAVAPQQQQQQVERELTPSHVVTLPAGVKLRHCTAILRLRLPTAPPQPPPPRAPVVASIHAVVRPAWRFPFAVVPWLPSLALHG